MTQICTVNCDLASKGLKDVEWANCWQIKFKLRNVMCSISLGRMRNRIAKGYKDREIWRQKLFTEYGRVACPSVGEIPGMNKLKPGVQEK